MPVLVGGEAKALAPQPINRISSLANEIGGTLFGGDQISEINTPLPSRAWTSLPQNSDGKMSPADRWSAISGNADKAGDERYSTAASHIAHSLRAAGIRLRDASDGYHSQLMAAIEGGRAPGKRFSNIPMRDIQLAFHSVLSELASARDYLASALGCQLGAPERIDGLNRLDDWLSAAARLHHRAEPVVSDFLAAYDATSADPWLFELTQYRNLFLHRQPLGGSDSGRWLTYREIDRPGFKVPVIEMPLGDDDPSAPGRDALLRFIELYRKLTEFFGKAATSAPHPDTLPHFVAE